jgi:hypothetical protein
MPQQLRALFEIMPAPALSDERIDAAKVRARAGYAKEQEEIEPVSISFDAADSMLELGGFCNGTAIIALQWLSLNRGRLTEWFGHARRDAEG